MAPVCLRGNWRVSELRVSPGPGPSCLQLLLSATERPESFQQWPELMKAGLPTLNSLSLSFLAMLRIDPKAWRRLGKRSALIAHFETEAPRVGAPQ